MTIAMRFALLLCGVCALRVASAQDEAAALAECQAQQQRLQEMEDTMPPAADPGWTMSRGLQPQSEVQYQRALTDRACSYARALREKPLAPKARPIERPRSSFRPDAPAPAVAPAPQQQIAPRSPPPPQPVMRREAPAQSNVGGTKPRRPAEESSPPPQ